VCLGEALGGAQIHPGAAPNDDGNLVFNFSLHKHFRSFYGLCCVVFSTAFGIALNS
jgi:hypothetical protein